MKKSKRRGAARRADEGRSRESPVAQTRRASLGGIARPLAILVALAVIVYANALRNGFALDDIPIVAENPVVRSIGNVGSIFGTNYWSRGGTETIGDPTLYRPLTVFTYAIDHAMWGESAAGFHATNIVLHAVTTAVVFLIALELLATLGAAFAAAAIFAVHPIHTEAVTSVIGRAEVLATLFFLLAFWVLRQRTTRIGNRESGIENRQSGTRTRRIAGTRCPWRRTVSPRTVLEGERHHASGRAGPGRLAPPRHHA